ARGRIAVWHVVAIATVAGTASALYAPVMQAVIPSLVEPADLLNAISLNSVQFNLARVVGPAVAGTVYGAVGPAGCFALNACGFVVLAAAASAVGFGSVLAALTVVRTVQGVGLLFFVMGVLQVTCVASLNTAIQVAVDDRMRGRVMSMMMVILFGFITIGSLLLGALGDWIGVPAALASGGGVVAVAGAAA